MINFSLLFLSIIPGLAICYYIYSRDKHEAEPHQYLLLCFFFGMLSTYPALKMEEFGAHDLRLGISEDPWITLTFAFLVISFSEELVKFIFLRYAIYPKDDFNEPMDGIVYAVMIGMGFATMENILYVLAHPDSSKTAVKIALLRMFTAVPAHAAFAVSMGYFVGLAKYRPERESSLLLLGLFSAILLHGLYDFFLFQKMDQNLAIFTFITLGISIIGGFYFIRQHSDYSERRNARKQH
jgi:RsiW-degrading membrane proteinase PrsW (M82 family)